MLTLDDVVAEAARLGMWCHVATVTPEGEPHVVPVHPAWFEGKVYALVGPTSRKMRNIAANPAVCLHWQVGEDTGFDSLIVWGTGVAVDDLARKERLWDGVFDYDLAAFEPGGPAAAGFLEVTPSKAVVLRQFGMGGREEWRSGTGR